MKKYALITACNDRCGDFLTDHWYPSLVDNVNLAEVDIVVLDYGLSEKYKSKLAGVIFYPGKLDGHITSIRYRDLLSFLQATSYEQIAMCDGGDIIFQTDISSIFVPENTNFRGVLESTSVRFDLGFLDKFKPQYQKQIIQAIQDKPIVNGGFVLGPTDKYQELCVRYLEMIKALDSYGPDQVGVTYLAYQMGFEPLDKTYNFSIVSFYDVRFIIKQGEFYFNNGEKIAVVHNSGRIKWFRPIKNFGFGKDYNHVGYIYYIGPYICKMIDWGVRIRYQLLKLFR